MISNEIKNVRYGQVRRGKGFMLFEFRGRTYEAPEPYPWTLDPNAGAKGRLRMRMLAAKALLCGEARKLSAKEASA